VRIRKKLYNGKASAGLVQDGGYRLVMVMAIMMLNEEKIDTYDWPLQLGAQGLL
jgi:hypothetical protein